MENSIIKNEFFRYVDNQLNMSVYFVNAYYMTSGIADACYYGAKDLSSIELLILCRYVCKRDGKMIFTPQDKLDYFYAIANKASKRLYDEMYSKLSMYYAKKLIKYFKYGSISIMGVWFTLVVISIYFDL